MSAKTGFLGKIRNIVSLRFFITLIVIIAGVIPIIVIYILGWAKKIFRGGVPG